MTLITRLPVQAPRSGSRHRRALAVGAGRGQQCGGRGVGLEELTPLQNADGGGGVCGVNAGS